jgi:leucyl aminopeptidase
MHFSVKVIAPEKERSGCLVLGVFRDRTLPSQTAAVDRASDGAIAKLRRRGDIDGELGHNLLLQALPGVAAERVLLVGCGERREFRDSQYRRAVTEAFQMLQGCGAADAALCLTQLEVPERDAYWRVRQAVEQAHDVLYRFDELKSKKDTKRPKLRRALLSVASRREVAPAEGGVRDGAAIAEGVELARTLGNLPANICTPSYLAQQARRLARRHSQAEVRVLDEAAMKRLGMHSLLSVARGSREAAKLIILQYKGAKREHKPVVLVGKGVTFDSGGISIKPAAAMDEMKFDMCGAASVLGVLSAAMELALPLTVIGVIPATENLPDGNASKPGDVITSLSGQTVEVLNTDAEGRLILNDALTYAGRYKPEVVIDVATLTGACVVALGAQASGLFTNDPALGEALLAAGRYSGDRAWELPLWEDYQEQLKSNFADMANVGGREAGAITAACFLSRFARDYRWAHLDIAGTAWRSGEKKGATGRPVTLLTQYLLEHGRRGRSKSERR